jgi:mRNA degradation ribonuclease J1/J2
MEECKSVVLDAFESCDKEGKQEWEVVKAVVRKALRRFLARRTDRFPMILPVVMEV